MTRRLACILTAALALAAMPGTAAAHTSYPNTPHGVAKDCGAGHDPLWGHYTIRVLHRALHHLDPSTIEYTTCADAIQNAIQKDSLGAPKHRTPRSHGEVTKSKPPVIVRPNQPQIRKQLHNLRNEGGLPVTLPTGQTVTPGAVTTRGASFLSSLPTPLIVVLAALLAAVVAVGGRALQNVVRTRRSR